MRMTHELHPLETDRIADHMYLVEKDRNPILRRSSKAAENAYASALRRRVRIGSGRPSAVHRARAGLALVVTCRGREGR